VRRFSTTLVQRSLLVTAALCTMSVLQPGVAAAQGCARCDEVMESGVKKHHFHTLYICGGNPPPSYCYDCDSGAGCHTDYIDGTCDDNHFHCEGGREDLAALVDRALEAFYARRFEVLRALTHAHPETFTYNGARKSFQIFGCTGAVVGNLPFPAHFMGAKGGTSAAVMSGITRTSLR
jgi:hypothetical protein